MGRVRFAVILVLTLAALLAGCSGDDEVTMTEVSHPDTKDMVVWSPGGDGPWPVVYALPGRSGLAQVDLDVLGPALAEQGVLVIATDYHTGDTVVYTDGDVECGYRYTREIAEDHGGDLSQPVTMLGYDYGGIAATIIGLDTNQFGPQSTALHFPGCFSGVDRPDLIIALGSCHNNWLSDPLPAVEITRPFNDTDGTVLIVSGENDDVCPADQHVAPMLAVLDERGIEATGEQVADASHQNLVLHEQANGGAALTAEDPVAQDTVTAILQAIEDAQQP